MNQNSNLKKEVLKILMENPLAGRGTISKLLGVSEKKLRPLIKECKHLLQTKEFNNLEEAHEELIEESVKLQKQKQRLMDQQRIERKIRDKYRVDNAISDYANEIVKLLKDKHFEPVTIKHASTGKKMGVFCISDEHFNELIDLPHNKYDFNVAAKRLKKYVTEAKKYFSAQGVTDVLIARLGDSINSTRRMDELLNQAANRAKATLLAAFLIEQVILDLNQEYNISVVSVCGNESRVEMEHAHSDIMLTNNHDFTINELLKIMFRNTNVSFIDGNASENVLNVNGKNILFLHGDQIGKGDVEKKVMQIKGKYASHGIAVDYLVFGHIHSSYVADLFARSSSLCGSNAYSDGALQLSSRASQLLLLVNESDIDGVKVDLQEVGDLEGYDIDKQLEAYDAKSSKRLNDINKKYFVVGAV